MKQLGIGLVALALVPFTPSLGHAAYMQSGESTTIMDAVNDDVFVGGTTVSVTAPIHGELFSGGQNVTISNTVDRNIIAGGNIVTIKNGAGHNAYVGGNTVTLSGTFGHDVFVGGTSVIIEDGTVIHGSLYAGGETVTIHGTVDGDVKVSGTNVTSNAVIAGSVSGYVQALTFTGGSIGGDLAYRSDADAKGLNTVTVKGATTRSTPTSMESSGTSKSEGFDAFGAFFRFLSIMLFGALLILLLPKKVATLADDVRGNWGTSLGWGLAGLIGGPILAMLSFATLIGWPVGMIILALWMIELFISAILGTIVLGSLIMRMKSPNWWTALAVGALAIVVLTSLPAVGFLVRFVAFLALTLPAFGATLQWWKKTLA